MATLDQKIAAERQIRALVEKGELPEPDVVEYGYTCIRVIWLEQKVVVVVDIDELDEAESASDDDADEPVPPAA